MKQEEIEYKDHKIELHTDDDPHESPRDWDNVGTMLCWHRNYILGDKHDYATPQDFQEAKEEMEIVVILPLYLYDHSGIGISTTNDRYPYNCPWDSMQVGYIYVTHEDVKREWKGDAIAAAKYLRGEVETYNSYLAGDVWGYMTTDEDGEHIDSCWGYYPDTSPLRGKHRLQYMIDEAEASINHHIAEEHDPIMARLQEVCA